MPRKSKEGRAEYQRERNRRKRAEAADPAFPVPKPPADPAAALARWPKSKLKVPTGPLRGEPFILAPWQIDFFHEALAPGILEAGCSLPRKCGKSGGLSTLFSACLVGSLHRPA